ncbi:MAG: PKD domain-containing protein [bacterium]|nr:PKD domain-containing protein [bacterium]
MKKKFYYLLICILLSLNSVFAQPPVINSVTPDLGYNNSTTPITINGENFSNNSRIYISAGGAYIAGSACDSTTSSYTHGGLHVKGNYAYYGDEYKGLQIVDISNTKAPYIAVNMHIEDSVNGLYISGNYAYVISSRYPYTDIGSSLRIINISEPLNPIIVGSASLSGSALGVCVKGNYAYVATYSGLQIVDISSPENPYMAASVIGIGSAKDVYIEGNYAYVATSTGLHIIDINNPVIPHTEKSVANIGSAKGIYVSGNYAYAAVSDYAYTYPAGPTGLQVIDISDPENAFKISNVNITGPASDVYVAGNYAYVADANGVVQIIDISYPLNPILIRNIPIPSPAISIYVEGNYVYVLSESAGLQIIDIGVMVNPSIVANAGSPGSTYHQISGNYAYIANGKESSLQIFNMSDPLHPAYVRSVETTGRGNGLYIAQYKVFIVVNGSYAVPGSHTGLQIVNISDPEDPFTISNIDIPVNNVIGVVVSGHYAYVTGFNYTGEGILQVVDITFPSNPTLGNRLVIPGPAYGGYNPCIKENYLYVPYGAAGLQVIDISVPGNPTIKSSVITSGGAQGLHVSGNYAYVATTQGLDIINISDPLNPLPAGSIYKNAGYHGVDVDGNYAYVGGPYGLEVIDLYNGTVVTTLGGASSGSWACNTVSLAGRYVYVVNQHTGLQIIDKFSAGTMCWPVNFIDNNTINTVIPNGFMRGSYNIKVVDFAEEGINYNAFNILNYGEPAVTLDVNPDSGVVPLPVSFTARAFDIDGNITNYEWDFNGDGNFDTSTFESTISYTYLKSGIFNAKVRVTDNDSQTAMDVKPVNISNRPPAVTLNTNLNSGYAPLKVDFAANASDIDGHIASYKWDFDGDGNFDVISYESTISHTYPASGVYNVKVKVTDNIGASASDTTVINIINTPPGVSLNVNPDTGNVPLYVYFTAEATDPDGYIANYEWDLNGDGNYEMGSYGNTIDKIYDTSGVFNVKVRVTDNDGAIQEAGAFVSVTEASAPPGEEKYFTDTTIFSHLSVKKACLNNVAVTGGVTGSLNFTEFEIIKITTGSFAGKGFSKGKFEALVEGNPYSGEWQGMIFDKLSENKIYMKGTITGRVSAAVEGYLTELSPGSGIYNKYEAVWKINRLDGIAVSINVNLNGIVTYNSSSVFTEVQLGLLQTNIEGNVYGDYSGILNTVLTRVRVTDESNPYYKEGFTIVSYNSGSGAGYGWAYNKPASENKDFMKGIFVGPISGIATAILDETQSPRTLNLTLESVDLAMAHNLKVNVWGPVNASPGQLVSYWIEYRNDGFVSADSVAVSFTFDTAEVFQSASSGGSYDADSHTVSWVLPYISARSNGYLYVDGAIIYGVKKPVISAKASIFLQDDPFTIIGQDTTSLNNGFARDPNIKYGPEGNVSAGQTLNYKVQFENVGEGIAFGVYFTDVLDEDLDDSTLEIGPVMDVDTNTEIAPAGIYNSSTRTITWFVGEVGPHKGGYANISVKVKADSPGGTEIINFATVYFPSVPEETRTNGVVSMIPLDNIPPVTTANLSEGPNENGWNKNDVTVTLNAVDNDGGTGVKEIHYSVSGIQPMEETVSGNSAQITISSEGVSTLAYWAVDNAGNPEGSNSHEPIVIKIDKTAPTITAGRSEDPNASGWNNSDVTVTFNGADNLSGIGTLTSPVTAVTEGANQVVAGTAVDLAGNSAEISVTLNIDKTVPVVNAGNDVTFNEGETVVLPVPDVQDTMSGIEKSSNDAPSSYHTGYNTVTVTAVDKAGNSASDSLIVTIVAVTTIENDLNNLKTMIDSLGDSAFKNNAANRKNALSNKIDALTNIIGAGRASTDPVSKNNLLGEAISKLKNDIQSKMDGCGSSADNNDWIGDCGAQYQLNLLINKILGVLNDLKRS